MHTLRHILAIGGIGLALTLPLAASAEEASANEAEPKENICFWVSSVRDFRAIDNKHVYLKGTGKEQKFLATLFQHCHGVRWAETIALQSRPTSRICSNGNEHLQVFDHSRSSLPKRCLISDIERVESLDAAKALVAKRKADKKAQEEKDVSELELDDDTRLQ